MFALLFFAQACASFFVPSPRTNWLLPKRRRVLSYAAPKTPTGDNFDPSSSAAPKTRRDDALVPSEAEIDEDLAALLAEVDTYGEKELKDQVADVLEEDVVAVLKLAGYAFRLFSAHVLEGDAESVAEPVQAKREAE